MKEALKRHLDLKQWTMAMFAIFVGSMFMTGLNNAYVTYAKFQERTSHPHEWVKYDKILAAKEDDGEVKFVHGFETHEDIGFISFSEVFKAGDVIWYDHMECSTTRTGTSRKLKTQVWADYADVGKSNLERIWLYESERPKPSERFCKMCGKVILTTPNGFKKEETYCSNLFKVNIDE